VRFLKTSTAGAHAANNQGAGTHLDTGFQSRPGNQPRGGSEGDWSSQGRM
jgi:hypothetical protein